MKKNAKMGAAAFLSNICVSASTVVSMSYVSYCFTDLAHVKPGLASAAMSLVSVIGLIFSFFSGVLIQRTHTKNGQYRPWYLWSTIISVCAVFLMFFDYGNATLTLVLVTLGYLLAALPQDLSFISMYGLYEKISAGDSSLRNVTSGWGMAGTNVGYIIYGACFLSLVYALGGDNLSKGYAFTNVILAVLTVIGVLIMYRASKPYDVDNTAQAGEEVENVSIKETIKSAFTNRLSLAVLLGDIVRYGTSFTFTFLLIYQCQDVLGDIMAYSVVLVFSSIGGVVGSMISPYVIKLCGGRKRTAVAAVSGYGILYVGIAFFGNHYWALMILYLLVCIVQFSFDAVDMMLYLDAGEVWYNRTGNDTRTYAMSLNGIMSKASQAIASVLMGSVLVAVNYQDGTALSDAGKIMLTRFMGFIPAAGCLFFVLIMLIVHNVSDKEVERCIEENQKKDAELYGSAEY